MTGFDADPAVRSCPIDAAATAVRWIETSRIVHVQTETRLSDALAREHAIRFRTAEVSRSARHYVLENAILDSDSLLLVQDGAVLPETAYMLPPRHAGGFDPDPDRLIRVTADEDIVIGCNNASMGYQHWLAQCLPAIDWCLSRPRTRPARLAVPTLPRWQEETLELLGYQDVPRLILQPGRHYLFPHVEYCDFLNDSTMFGICRSRIETARRMLAGIPFMPLPHRILYVPGPSRMNGPISNAAEVRDLMRQSGAFVVDDRPTHVAERINLFRQADVVIGPHCAGLTDIMFCRPGTLLWEWVPTQPLNLSMNRLARSAGLDYWGDVLGPDPAVPGRFLFDIPTLACGLQQIAQRPRRKTPRGRDDRPAPLCLAGTPADEILFAFESLGDNCEFGLVQRYCGIEPLGLLRLAGFHAPVEQRLSRLTEALRRGFDGLGTPDTIKHFFTPHGPPREFMIHELVYDLHFHSGVHEDEIAPDAIPRRESRRLTFLRRKLLEDLQSGEKIWVWKSRPTTHLAQVEPLLDTLRRLGPNKLLWVVEADGQHPPGTAERLNTDLVKGWIEPVETAETECDVRIVSWLHVCEAAHAMLRPERSAPLPVLVRAAGA